MDKKEQLEKVYEQLPILSIEGIGIKELSEKFIDWYFQDDSSASIIKRIKDKALNEERAEWIDLIKKLKEEFSILEAYDGITICKVIDKIFSSKLNPNKSEVNTGQTKQVQTGSDTRKGCKKMFCSICGAIDNDFSAYCIKHGRSPHAICGEQISDNGISGVVVLCKNCKSKEVKA